MKWQAGFGATPPALLLQQALRGVDIGRQRCTCPEGYHALWGVMKLAGRGGGLYREAHSLREPLLPLLAAARTVLVGGAADDNSLRFLFALAAQLPPRQRHWAVADRCPAALALVAEQTAADPDAVDLIGADLSHLPQASEPWDFIFLHYTLAFVDSAARQAALRGMAARLAPQGHLLCVAKFGAAGAPAAPWQQKMREQLLPWSTQHEPIAQVLDQWLAAHAAWREQRALAQPTLAQLRQEVQAAGLRVIADHATGRAGADNDPSSRLLVIGHG